MIEQASPAAPALPPAREGRGKTARFSVLHEGGHGGGQPEVAVCVSLYNYGHFVQAALNSVFAQTHPSIELIIVDDASSDNSPEVALEWLRMHEQRFVRTVLARHTVNSRLCETRNTAVGLCAAEYVFILDADNELYPRCLERCLEALRESAAWFAYPILETMGDASGLIGNYPWSPERLARVNYIDAMVLLRRERLLAVSGYEEMAGWEDYDLWCKIHESGGYGLHVPQILARYRVHSQSMLRTETNRLKKIRAIHARMRERHPWLQLKTP
jgi:glycosyltransferase involved in cell wall biosynthesis